MKTKLATVTAVLLSLLAPLCQMPVGYAQGKDQQQDRGRDRYQIYRTVHQKADLPIGGEFVPDPNNKSVIYYCTSRTQVKDKPDQHNPAGLYRSGDAGQTWNLVSRQFNFTKLFIHPATSELFAIITYNDIAPDADGFLTVHYVTKAIASKDGKRWKDIMGKQKNASLLHHIKVDPDHPQRIRLFGHAYRGFELVAVDDQYTDWKRIDYSYGTPF